MTRQPRKHAEGPAIWDTAWQETLKRAGFRVDTNEWTYVPAPRERRPER